MGVLDNLFGKKIIFTNEMNQFIEKVKEIEWFNNCGKIYQKKLFYNDELENIKNASKKLNYIKNHKEFVILENIFITADRRITNYLKENNEKEYNWTWNKLADVINKRFMDNSSEIDFMKIENNYCIKFNVKNNRMIYKIFRSILVELFFIKYIPNLPLFYNAIFEIYKDGHIIIEWEGKQIEAELWSKEPVKKTDGKIIIC